MSISLQEEVSVDMDKTRIICKETGLLRCEDWSCIELVYGMPGKVLMTLLSHLLYYLISQYCLGTGKTYHIRDKMKTIPENHQVTIAINEAFTTVSAIERLRTLPRDARNCAIFFNFTIFPPMVSVSSNCCSKLYKSYVFCSQNGADTREKEHYQQLMKTIRWFFFELLILGYVEDPATGLSFHFPAGLSWALYTEV